MSDIRYPDFSNAKVGDKVTWLKDGNAFHGTISSNNGEWVDVEFADVGMSEPFYLNGCYINIDPMPSLYHGHLSISDFQPSIDSAYRREE